MQEVKSENFFPFEEEGDAIEGKYLGSKKDMNNEDIFSIQIENGDVYVIGSAVIRNKFKNVEVNKHVRVTFIDRKKSAKGLVYKNYKVEME